MLANWRPVRGAASGQPGYAVFWARVRYPYTVERGTPNMSAICWTGWVRASELLGELGLVGRQSSPSAALAASGTGGGQAVAGVGHDQFALQLGEHAQHAEHG